ncbi:unnamed protein product [Rotaria sp. Silwood2]|nr:unnamed protein product [Rotaria sp. Silwood2]CAF4024986.1 unnamed protein product [Rotaria sp. Silwood2]CAF4122543.1 unnamed protein product [Rotaria sp. Silwood2]CAF4145826.1 unnamed protein product [Rotaria sp. Silwood2]
MIRKVRLQRQVSLKNFAMTRSFDYVDDENQATSSLAPVVLLVIQDDLDTVEQVHEAVAQNNISVVLLEGIGTCSDLFAT